MHVDSPVPLNKTGLHPCQFMDSGSIVCARGGSRNLSTKHRPLLSVTSPPFPSFSASLVWTDGALQNQALILFRAVLAPYVGSAASSAARQYSCRTEVNVELYQCVS